MDFKIKTHKVKVKHNKDIKVMFTLLCLNGEVWKEINFNKQYKVSNKGRILTSRDTIAKPFINNSGYSCIGLWCNNRKHTITVHKLVAMHFLDYNDNFDIDHIDGNKQNNDVSNLRLVSHKDNCSLRKTPKVIRVTKEGTIIKEYNSYRIAGRDLGFGEATLRKRVIDENIVSIYNIRSMKYMYFKRL